jgi:hypothetical protein
MKSLIAASIDLALELFVLERGCVPQEICCTSMVLERPEHSFSLMVGIQINNVALL